MDLVKRSTIRRKRPRGPIQRFHLLPAKKPLTLWVRAKAEATPEDQTCHKRCENIRSRRSNETKDKVGRGYRQKKQGSGTEVSIVQRTLSKVDSQGKDGVPVGRQRRGGLLLLTGGRSRKPRPSHHRAPHYKESLGRRFTRGKDEDILRTPPRRRRGVPLFASCKELGTKRGRENPAARGR